MASVKHTIQRNLYPIKISLLCVFVQVQTSQHFFFLGIKFYKIDPRVLSNFLTVAFLGEMAKLATARTLRMEKSFLGPFYSALI